jgi:rSAM/selenodomain-associated transferase 2/rSAM/selenodomain-associated transferase 1
MARCPEAGKAKTRLIPALGPERAAKLHQCLVQHTLGTVREIAARRSVQIDVQFAGGSAEEMRRLFGDDLNYSPQAGASLGDRMSSAVSAAFADGCRRVVVIGTDCPQLQAIDLEYAFDSLVHTDITIGPAVDGGYYLIGLRESLPAVFENINWSTDTVLQETLEKIRECRKTNSLLPALSDVDYPEDLIFCRQIPDAFDAVLPRQQKGLLSIIIPTLNEQSNLPALLNQLQEAEDVEIIVSDGGSTDETCRLAEQLGVKVVHSGKGRGRQMNAGAALARGDVLLFLHADSRLPPDFVATIRKAIQAGHTAGAFRLRIDDPRWLYRLVEFGANLRSRWLQLPYGDQAMFIQATAFFAINGFQNWPLLEDYDFAKRLRRVGRILITNSATTVSARRWQRIGVLKATVLNQVIIAAFRLGVSPKTLAEFYTRFR